MCLKLTLSWNIKAEQKFVVSKAKSNQALSNQSFNLIYKNKISKKQLDHLVEASKRELLERYMKTKVDVNLM